MTDLDSMTVQDRTTASYLITDRSPKKTKWFFHLFFLKFTYSGLAVEIACRVARAEGDIRQS